METQMIHTRIDQKLKHEAESIFNALGINTTEAIRIFFTKVVMTRGIPFELKIPNRKTLKAIEDSRLNQNLSPFSLEDLDKAYDA